MNFNDIMIALEESFYLTGFISYRPNIYIENVKNMVRITLKDFPSGSNWYSKKKMFSLFKKREHFSLSNENLFILSREAKPYESMA